MPKDWNLIDLCTNSMKYESAAAGEEKISGVYINKLGAYIHIINLQTRVANLQNLATQKKNLSM